MYLYFREQIRARIKLNDTHKVNVSTANKIKCTKCFNIFFIWVTGQNAIFIFYRIQFVGFNQQFLSQIVPITTVKIYFYK